jgi:uncharacterized protein YbjQ (UPF0145 family)
MADDNVINGVAPVKDKVEYLGFPCCCIQKISQQPITEITANSDQIKLDESDKKDLEVFISSLSSPPAGSKIIVDHGLISVIVGKMRGQQMYNNGTNRGYQNYMQKKLEGDMAEMERARGMAFGKLRSKAKELDANGVLNIKVDLETVGQASIVYASGNAVQLSGRGEGCGLKWAGHDVPPYFPWEATTAVTLVKPIEPLEMSRGEKN